MSGGCCSPRDLPTLGAAAGLLAMPLKAVKIALCGVQPVKRAPCNLRGLAWIPVDVRRDHHLEPLLAMPGIEF